MNTSDIILAIDAEIAQLQKVKSLLTDTGHATKRRPGRPAAPSKTTSPNPVKFAKKTKGRTMSAEGRARIAAAQKARWARSKRVARKVAHKAASVFAKKAVDWKAAQVKKGRVVRNSKQSKAGTAAIPTS